MKDLHVYQKELVFTYVWAWPWRSDNEFVTVFDYKLNLILSFMGLIDIWANQNL